MQADFVYHMTRLILKVITENLNNLLIIVDFRIFSCFKFPLAFIVFLILRSCN